MIRGRVSGRTAIWLISARRKLSGKAVVTARKIVCKSLKNAAASGFFFAVLVAGLSLSHACIVSWPHLLKKDAKRRFAELEADSKNAVSVTICGRSCSNTPSMSRTFKWPTALPPWYSALS